MLGRRIVDHIESAAGDVEALGLLPVETNFACEKMLANVWGDAPFFASEQVAGYEIHHGRVRACGGEPLFTDAYGREGCRVGAVMGTSRHGVFEHDGFRRAVLGWVAAERALDWLPGEQSFASAREERLDRLADLIEHHVDEGALAELISKGAPQGLPAVPPAGGVR
jgi:adenosylcobyric acid synthase